MVLVRTYASACLNFNLHRPSNDIGRSEVFGHWGVSFHKLCSFRVQQISSLDTCAFCDQDAGTVYPAGVKLNKLHVLEGETCSCCHGTPITGSCMCRGAGK